MARDIKNVTPAYMAGAAWIETCSSLSRECSAVGMGQAIRSRHLALRVQRALKRPPWKAPPDDE